MRPRAARLFFALMPPPAVASALAAAAADVRYPAGRPLPAGNLHVTLAFMGAVDATACAEAAARVTTGTPFVLDFDHAGWFERARVAWLGPAQVPPALTALAGALRSSLDAAGLPCDRQAFRCHLTIARDVDALALPQAVTPVRWTVTEFALVESVRGAAGTRYESRAKWPLRPVFCGETARPPVR
jgi:2'-5' RNA ligase